MRGVPASRYVLFLGVAVVGALVDLVTKWWVFKRLGPPGPDTRISWVWPEYVGLQTSLNEGALFGLGQGHVLLFAGLSIAAVIAIPVWLFYAGAAADRLLCLALALITAGVFGNLYDRLALHGLRWSTPPRTGELVRAVRDFLLLQINDHLRWPNFNVADSLLVCGAGLLLWQAIRSPQNGRPMNVALTGPTNGCRTASHR